MWLRPDRWRRRLLATAALLLAGGAATAAELSLNSSLARWLDQTAAPELAELYSRHPRFEDVTLRFTALRSGQPEANGNALSHAIEQRLTRSLRRVDGLRIAFDAGSDPCALPDPDTYLVGIDWSGSGSRRRLSLGVIDVAAGVWVGGIELSWQGTLTREERRAVTEAAPTVADGSAAHPLPPGDSRQAARLLGAGLRCALPTGVDGGVYFTEADAADLRAVQLALKQDLQARPQLALTADPVRAPWRLELQRTPSAGLDELTLVLTDSAGERPQRVAQVFVASDGRVPATGGTLADRPDATDRTMTVDHRAATLTVPTPLLSTIELHRAAREGICDDRHSRVNSCAEVSFELRRPAYLLVFSTREQTLGEVSCSQRLERAEAGERRFRLRVPPSPAGLTGRPDAGFYVLATDDRTLARRLDRLLKAAPGTCAGTPVYEGVDGWTRWLTALRSAVDGVDRRRLSWQRVYFQHGTDGIQRLETRS